jgi:hypothetical protein
MIFYNDELEEGKQEMIIVDLKELAYKQLLLLIDDKTNSEKKVDDNAFMAWGLLKNKFAPVSALSLVKMEKLLCQCAGCSQEESSP